MKLDEIFSLYNCAVIGITIGISIYYLKSQKPIANVIEEKIEEMENRNILVLLPEYDGFIFFGSQTGSSEDFSNRLSKDLKRRFKLNFLVCDLENYDLENLNSILSDKLCIFLLSTYGEGEPTDNAINFYNLLFPNPTFPSTLENQYNLKEDTTICLEIGDCSKEDKPLYNLNYCVFGLGNSTYEHFNLISKQIDFVLDWYGGTRLMEVMFGDDDQNLEEDFIRWKDILLPNICKFKNIEYNDISVELESSFIIKEVSLDMCRFNGRMDDSIGKQGMDVKHPYYSKVDHTKQLFTTHEDNRYAIHMELDIKGSGIKYKTGDHVGVWPINNKEEVELFKKTFDLENKGDQVVEIQLKAGNKNMPFPNPASYDTILTHYLDISSAPSREFISNLSNFCKSNEVKAFIKDLGCQEKYKESVLGPRMTIAQVLLKIREIESNSTSKTVIPLEIVWDSLLRVTPRYYSISSGDLLHPDKIDITASVLRYPTSNNKTVYGVCTNYLLDIHESNSNGEASKECKYNISRTKNKEGEIELPIFARTSHFKLPKSPQVPILLIGPGSGIAPFRGFIQDRLFQFRNKVNIGKIILLYGCRKKQHDFLYHEEWPIIIDELGNKFQMFNAFSREQKTKFYVQDIIKNQYELISELIFELGASIYLCGDAKYMAKDVHNTLLDLFVKYKKISMDEANDFFTKLKAQGRFQEDVWS